MRSGIALAGTTDRAWWQASPRETETPPWRGVPVSPESGSTNLRSVPSTRNSASTDPTHDNVMRRWIGRPSREGVDREVEGPPPGVHGRRPSAKRRPKFRQDERRAGGGVEVGRHLVGVIGRMLVVLGQRDLPRHLLGRGIDLDGATQAPHGLEYLARDLRYGPVG